MIILFCITLCILTVSILISNIIVLKPYLDRKNDIREKKVKNDLYRLYSELDPLIIQQNIDELVDRKIKDYMLINIHTRESEYMNNEDIDMMIKTISAEIYINLSDMYITFIKMIHNVSTDDDLIVYVNNLVKMRSIPIVTDNNKLI